MSRDLLTKSIVLFLQRLHLLFVSRGHLCRRRTSRLGCRDEPRRPSASALSTVVLATLRALGLLALISSVAFEAALRACCPGAAFHVMIEYSTAPERD